MRKTHTSKKGSEEGWRREAETYQAPPPPSEGKVVSLDCHPDTFTAAAYEGRTPHEARKLEERNDIGLEALEEWLSANFDRRDIVLMEAGSNSFEVARRLMSRGLRVCVLESRHVGKFARDHSDNDRMAAERIAMAYLAGGAPCVWLPDEETRRRRDMLSLYLTAVKRHNAASNTYKDYLNTRGVRLAKRKAEDQATFEWVLARRDWTPAERELLSIHWSELRHAEELRRRMNKMICREVWEDAAMLALMKLLGIGPVNAFALVAIIGEVRRFATPAKLVAYVGLNPGLKTSGRSKAVRIGVGGRGRKDLRSLLVQGAQAVLRRGRATKIGAWGMKLLLRKGNRNVAACAVARKLLVQVWYLLSGRMVGMLEGETSYRLKLKKMLGSLGKKYREEMGLSGQISQLVENAILTMKKNETKICPG
jgi:transposase